MFGVAGSRSVTYSGRMTKTMNAHSADCLCVPCMTADMDATIRANGLDPARYGVEATETAERTRYATPGTACGNGVVHKASPAQIRFIKRLLAERDTTNLVRLPGSEDVDNISKRGASDLIERLLACPVRPDAPRTDGPSEKQVAFAVSLAERKGIPDIRDRISGKSRREVSEIIDMLKNLADAPKLAAAEEEQVTDGMYRNPTTGEVFKVQRAVHGSGNLYAKILVVEDGSGRFEYAAGAIRKIQPAWRMTLEEAKRFGAVYGVCCNCAAPLTDEKSIAAGIGPVCATKF